MQPTQDDLRLFAEWSDQNQPQSLTIGPLELLELAERAQARAEAIKQANQHDVNIGTAPGIIGEMFSLDRDLTDSTMNTNGEDVLALGFIAVLFVLAIGLLWTVVHFAPLIDRWHL